ncbi:MAG: sugar transferase [Dehalococcoidia bacterium]|nr:MAG: sugar transferase [Dehalococcoidia bacterium]
MRSVANGNVELTFATPAEVVAYRELSGVAYFAKGAFDRLAAALILLVLALPMAIIAVAVKLSSPGPVLVRQIRVGRFGRPFTFYKFRSMRHDAEQFRDDLETNNNHDTPLIFKIRRDPRITRFGGFLRRTSLDELPNLFNVLRGEMSLVGPRPPLPREVAHYEARHMQRLAATPGITGLWQVRGRSELGFDEMVVLDLEYIDRWSLWLDVAILLQTPFAVASGRGAW